MTTMKVVLIMSKNIISFTIDKRSILNVKDSFNRIRGRVKIYGNDMVRAITRIYAKEYASYLISHGHKDTGKLIRSLNTKQFHRIRQGNKRGYGIKIPRYGFYLAFMKPHLVYLSGKHQFRGWARRKLGRVPRTIFVRPHNWIKGGNIRARIRAKKLVEKYMKAVVK